jgi:hypothetical protein
MTTQITTYDGNPNGNPDDNPTDNPDDNPDNNPDYNRRWQLQVTCSDDNPRSQPDYNPDDHPIIRECHPRLSSVVFFRGSSSQLSYGLSSGVVHWGCQLELLFWVVIRGYYLGCHPRLLSGLSSGVVVRVVIWSWHLSCHLGCHLECYLGCHLVLPSGVFIRCWELSFGLSSGVLVGYDMVPFFVN